MGMAMSIYCGDFDDTWVPLAIENQGMTPFNHQQMWIGYDNSNDTTITAGFYGDVLKPAINPVHPGMIDTYLKSEGVKKCPNKPSEWQLAMAYNFFNPLLDSEYYIVNPGAKANEYGPGAMTITFTPEGFASLTGTNDSGIQEPANTLVMWEHKAHSPACNFLQIPNWFESAPLAPRLFEEHFNALHRGGTTSLWADSHARRIVYKQLKRPMFSCRKDIYE